MSDHTPILLKFSVESCITHHKSFKFENAWLVEPELDFIVQEG